jgi:hypothetical protein
MSTIKEISYIIIELLGLPFHIEFGYYTELVWPAKAKYAARSPLHSTQKEKVKFIFNITKCDKIFDELLKHGNIKSSHIIPSIEELKGRA